jgi:hypothetical protein
VRITTVILAIAALAASVAFGQSGAESSVERQLNFAHFGTVQGAQEIVNAIRIITSVPAISLDQEQKAITLRGTAPQIEIAEWLFHELDQAPGAPPAQTNAHEYPGVAQDIPAPAGGPVVKIIYLSHTATPQALQEISNAVRGVADLPRIALNTAVKALTMRGTAAQAALAEWMLNALDKPAGQQPDPRSVTYGARPIPPSPGLQEVRVSYMTNPETPLSVQETVTMVRSIADVQRLFPCFFSSAVVSRGTPEQDALLAWLLDQVETPVAAQAGGAQAQIAAAREYPSEIDGQNSVRAVHLPGAATPQVVADTLAAIRAATGMRRTGVNTAHKVVAFRGTPSQVATAEQLIRERNTLAP